MIIEKKYLLYFYILMLFRKKLALKIVQRYKIILVLFLAFSSSSFGQQNVVFVYTDSVKSCNIEPFLKYTHTDSKVGIKQIEKLSDDIFKPYNWDSIPEDTSINWIKLTVKNEETKDVRLVLGTNKFDYLIVYQKDISGDWRLVRGGNKYPYEDMEFVHGINSYFNLYLPSNSVSDYYIRAKNDIKASYQYSPLPFTMYEHNYFRKYSNRQDFFNYFFWGAILIITLYNLVLYFQLRSNIYLYYVFNNITILAFVLTQSGVVSEMFFKDSSFHETLLLILGNVSFIFYVIFCKEFLGLRIHNPKLNRLFIKILCVWPLLLLLIKFNLVQLAVSLGGIIAIWMYTLIMKDSIRAIKNGSSAVKAFLYANIFYYCGIIISILQINNILPHILFGLSEVNFVQIGTLGQISLFSLTVGYRINKMRAQIVEKQLEQEKIKREEEQKRLVLIEEKNQELELKVKERTKRLEENNLKLEQQSQVLEFQKKLVEEKNKSITDSIHYAKRIQRALLASDKLLKTKLRDHFVLYKPKDIVSGDFYWAQQKDDWFYLVTADCTGHGVPGAFMSLLNISFLNEAVNAANLTKPNEILGYVRTHIIEALKTDGSELGGKDGMDCVLCAFNFKTNTLLASCANNQIWIFRGDEKVEIKPDKFPIGKHDRDQEPFTLYEVQLRQGDMIYTFTDGYADQFGGRFGKKFKYKQLESLIRTKAGLSMPDQHKLLTQNIDEWKGPLEQVDDILVIGIKV